MGQNTSNSVWKPCEDLQKTFDLCHCQQRVYNKVLRWNFVIDQILIFHHNLPINSLKILQCDFLDFFFLILSLIVEVYLWWKLQASLIFLRGRTCTIGGWLNTFLPHCIYIYILPTPNGSVYKKETHTIIWHLSTWHHLIQQHSKGPDVRFDWKLLVESSFWSRPPHRNLGVSASSIHTVLHTHTQMIH